MSCVADEAITLWREVLVDPLFVYFIVEQEPTTDFVKVGKANDPRSRVQTLQCGNPHRLQVDYVLVADDELEEQIHRMFDTSRVRGEWFGGGLTPLMLAMAHEISDAQMDLYQRENAGHHSIIFCAHKMLAMATVRGREMLAGLEAEYGEAA